MKLKLFWRLSKTNNYLRRKLHPEGENINIIQWNITTKFLSRRFTYQSFFILGHSYLSNFHLFVLQAIFYGVFFPYVFTGQSPSSNLLKRFLHIIARKKANQQYEKISLCINQCWNAPNLINFQFLANAFGNYVWLTEK